MNQILLNFAWAGLAVGTYFLGNGGADDSEPEGAVAPGIQSARAEDGLQGEENTVAVLGRGEKLRPGSATNFLLALRDARAREEAQLSAFARTVTPENARAMLAIFEETPRDGLTDRAFVEFLEAWGSLAAPQAISLVLESVGNAEVGTRWRVGLDRDANISSAVESFVSGWAAVDLAAAMEFTTKLRDEQETWESIATHLGILKALQRTDLDGAIAYSQQFYADSLEHWDAKPYSADKRARLSGLESMLRAIEEQRGLAGLEAWASRMDGEADGLRSYKLEATSRMLEILREESPARAAAWVAANAGQGYVPATDIVATAKVFADNPEGQLDWIAALPEAANRSALAGPFRAFLREDFDAASAWLASQPLDSAYDRAIAHFAGVAAAYDPEAARLWANEITEERLKAFTLKKIEDAEAAEVPRP